MTDRVLPIARLTEAGATEDELARLVDLFDRSDPAAQTDIIHHYAELSTAGITNDLAVMRERHHFDDEPDVGDGTEVDDAPDDPDDDTSDAVESPVDEKPQTDVGGDSAGLISDTD